VEKEEMLSKDDVVDLLNIQLLGVIPESQSVLKASNSGKPIVYDQESDAGQAYIDTVHRLLGQPDLPFRFIEHPKKGLWKSIFGKK
jgi:septum site-determining protein MinD